MIDIIRERLRGSDRRDGFLLDGFPRTVPQAEHSMCWRRRWRLASTASCT